MTFGKTGATLLEGSLPYLSYSYFKDQQNDSDPFGS